MSAEDCNSSSETKRLKTSASNVSQNSNSSSCSSGSRLSKSAKISKNGLHSTPSASTANSSSINDSINNSQMPSTSKVTDEEMVDVEKTDEIEHKLKKLIKKINKEQKPNLIMLKAKHKIPKHIAPLYKNAQSFVKKEKYSDAIDLMNEAIVTMPNVSRFYCLRANAYCERAWKGDLFCALKDFYKSLEIDPNNKESHLKLAQCMYQLNYYEIAYQCLSYFRQNQSKDTRYKEFKELEKKILVALKQDKQHQDKKPTEIKNKNETGYRKFVENLSRAYFTYSSQNSSTNANRENTTDNLDQSSSSSSSSSTSSSIATSFLDNIERSSSESDDRFLFNDDSDSFQMSQDSSVLEMKHTKSKKELQWRSDSYDFEQRFYGCCNVSTDIMEANFFGR